MEGELRFKAHLLIDIWTPNTADDLGGRSNMTRILKRTVASQLQMYFIIWVCLAIFLLSCGSDEGDDQLDTNPISPSSGHWGEVISIAGHDFGDEPVGAIIFVRNRRRRR